MDVIKALFCEVYCLEDWLCKADGSRTLKASLIREEDTLSYKNFVRTTILGVSDPVIQNGTFTLSQNSYQREVVLRVIERLIKRDGPGKNVLTVGFNVMSDDSNAHVSTGVSVEYRYPNNNVNRLHFKVWKQLLSRIGDDLMMYLLEKTSIFILLAPTCYLQIAGTPIYNAWPYESGKTFPVRTTEKHSHRKRRNSKKAGRTNKLVAEAASSNVTVQLAVDSGPDGRSGRKRKVSEMTDVPESEAKKPRTAGSVDEHQFNDRVHTSLVHLSENQIFNDSKRDNDKVAVSELTDISAKVNSQREIGLVTKDLNVDSIASSLKRKRDGIISEKSEYKRKDLKVCRLSNDSDHGDSLKAGPIFQHKVVNEDKTDKTENVDFDSLCTESERQAVQEHRGADNIGENMDQSLRAATEFNDGTKEVKKTEHGRGTLKSFRPYDHLMYLPRTSTLYNRNIREKIPKSATLSSVDSSTFSAAQYLYTKVFIDTVVHSDEPPVEVTAPGPVSGASPSWSENSSSEKLQEKTNDVNSVDIANKKVNKPNNQIDTCIYDKIKDSALNAVKDSCQTSFLSRPYCVKSDSHISCSSSIENRDESSFTKSEGRIHNETVIKAHPSFADSRYDLLKTPLSLLEIDTERAESKCADVKSSVNISGMKRLELLMKRKESILKNRKLPTGSVISCTKTETSPCDNEICDKKLNLETGINDRNKDSIKDTFNINMEKSVDLEHGRNVSENYENGYEVNNESVSDSMKVETADKASVNGNDLASQTLGSKLKVNIQVEAEDSFETINTVEKPIDLVNTGPLRNSFVVGVSVDHDQIEVKSQATGKKPDIEKQSDTYIDSNQEGPKIQIPVIPELLKLLEEFSMRHRKCPYKILLRHHCPVSWQQSGGKASVMKKSVTKATVAKLLGDHIHPRKVYLFLRASFLKTIPAQLFGSDHNKNVILKIAVFEPSQMQYRCLALGHIREDQIMPVTVKDISKLVSKGKFEKVCLGQLITGLKTSEIHWLHHLQCNSLRVHLLAKLVYWIFRDYIFILLKTYFYVTETTFIKYRLLYYRQSVWNKLYIQGFAGLLQRRILKPISEDFAEDSLKKGTSLGVGVLRFLPKQGSLRPIMNLGRNMSQQGAKKLSINQQLMDLLHILTYMKNETPSLVGAGKFGTDDIYTSWVQYCCRWRELGRPELFFVKTDIVNCYDTILQKKLYSVLEDVFSQIQDDLIVRKYATVMVARGNLKRTFHRAVSSLAEYEPDFVQVAKEMIDKNRMHDVILVDKVLHQHETKESLLQLLHSHLFSNIIKVGLKYYIQTGGISQGSVLSTLLCSIYYADMEREFFNITEDELLMRIVDDYLYVTPSQESAVKFLDLMLKGIPEYNCQVNVEKILVNFQYTHKIIGRVGCVEDAFPWCGMIFNTKTLEIGVDYCRYAGYKIDDSITFDLCHKPGLAMKKKILFLDESNDKNAEKNLVILLGVYDQACGMAVTRLLDLPICNIDNAEVIFNKMDEALSSSRPKCHSVFMDSNINSQPQICINCYQLFLLSAYKFRAYNTRLPHKQRADRNPRFFCGLISDLSKYVFNQTKKELNSRKECGIAKIEFVLSQSSLKWLCLKAFQSVLGCHHSLFKEILRYIKHGLKLLERAKVSRYTPPIEVDVLSGLDKQFKEIFG